MTRPFTAHEKVALNLRTHLRNKGWKAEIGAVSTPTANSDRTATLSIRIPKRWEKLSTWSFGPGLRIAHRVHRYLAENFAETYFKQDSNESGTSYVKLASGWLVVHAQRINGHPHFASVALWTRETRPFTAEEYITLIEQPADDE